jgi:hypothetical protein
VKYLTHLERSFELLEFELLEPAKSSIWDILKSLSAMNWLHCTLGALATWRVTHLVVAEDGPWDALIHLRKLSKSIAGNLLDCFYCSSLWVSIPFSVLLAQTLTDSLILWLALSGAAILLENLSAQLGQPAAAAYVVEGDQGDELLREGQQPGTTAE